MELCNETVKGGHAYIFLSTGNLHIVEIQSKTFLSAKVQYTSWVS
jgi:hypothetical protein